MKIYSIWRGAGGGAEGAFWFFSFFPGPAGHGRSWRKGAAASRSRSTGAGRGNGHVHVHGGLEDGTNNPPAHGATQGDVRRGQSCCSADPEKGGGGGRDPSILWCQRLELSCPPPSSPAGALLPLPLLQAARGCRQRAGSAGLPALGAPSPPRRAHHPSAGLPCGGGNDHRPGNGAGWRCNASRIY